jgi:hypothetical protein
LDGKGIVGDADNQVSASGKTDFRLREAEERHAPSDDGGRDNWADHQPAAGTGET